MTSLAARRTSKASGLLGRLSGGVLDAGFSSLATFVTGLTAAHYFATAVLGAYALAVTAASVAIAFPATLVFSSVERDNSIDADGLARLVVLPRSVAKGLLISLPAGVVAAALFFPVAPSSIDATARWQLTLTAGLFTALSPVQDHARRTLHQARVSFAAAIVSAAQLATVAVVLVSLVAFGEAHQALTPLLALTIANGVSLSVALLLARSRRGAATSTVSSSLRHCFPAGKWLLISALVSFGSGYGVVAVITAGSSSVAVGQAEAARLVAQPITLVIIAGTAVLSADIISSVAAGAFDRVRRLLRFFFLGVLVLAAAWVGLAGRPWFWSPLPRVLPAAYVQFTPLVVMIAAQALVYSIPVFSQIGMAAKKNRWFAVSSAFVAAFALGLSVVLRHHGEMALSLVSLAGAGGDIFAGYLLFRNVTSSPKRATRSIHAIG